MTETMVLCRNGRPDSIAQFEVEESLDLYDAIHKAAMDFCATDEGREHYRNSGKLTYQSFVEHVPNEICIRHGFRKTKTVKPDLTIESHATLINTNMLTRLGKSTDLDADLQLCSLAIQFARMWGIMEALDDSETMAEHDPQKYVLTWAEEFIRKDNADLVEFLAKKLEGITGKQFIIPADCTQ